MEQKPLEIELSLPGYYPCFHKRIKSMKLSEVVFIRFSHNERYKRIVCFITIVQKEKLKLESLIHFNCIEKQDVIIASIREFPEEYKVRSDIDSENINTAIIKKLSSLHESVRMLMLLLPMHYFGIGGDDRKFFNQICLQLNNPDITVQNIPLYRGINAKICIGMHFYSVVI